MQFLALVKLILSLLPMVLQAIDAVENAFPKATGSDKLGMVKGAVAAAAEHGGETVTMVEALWSPLTTIINSAVALKNKTGWPATVPSQSQGPQE